MKIVSFDDVWLAPRYSEVRSRKDVDLFSLWTDGTPVVSANMDTVTGVEMANAMAAAGAVGCLHRFWSVADNVKAFKECHPSTWCAVGIGPEELDRAKSLIRNGCNTLVLDIAHGASKNAADQVYDLRDFCGDHFRLIVGNFATSQSVWEFQKELGSCHVDAIKVGIGGGSVCTTRIVTGCGLPTLASVLDCARNTPFPVIADGGIRNSSDIVKCLVAGADAVMIGRLLAGTKEAPGLRDGASPMKAYRGSASWPSYVTQGKTAEHRTPEGVSLLVPEGGTAGEVVQQINAGIRSAMSYLNCTTLEELKQVEFIYGR